MQTQHTNGPRWQVKSESTGNWYDVDISQPHCTCPDWAIQSNTLKSKGDPNWGKYRCKHVKAAEADAGISPSFDPSPVTLTAKEQKEVRQKADAIRNRFRKQK